MRGEVDIFHLLFGLFNTMYEPSWMTYYVGQHRHWLHNTTTLELSPWSARKIGTSEVFKLKYIQKKNSLSWSQFKTAPCEQYEASHLAAIAVVCALWQTEHIFQQLQFGFCIDLASKHLDLGNYIWELHFPRVLDCAHCWMSLKGLGSPFDEHRGYSHSVLKSILSDPITSGQLRAR